MLETRQEKENHRRRATKRSINNSNTEEEFPAQKCVARERERERERTFLFLLLFRIVEDKDKVENLEEKKLMDGRVRVW